MKKIIGYSLLALLFIVGASAALNNSLEDRVISRIIDLKKQTVEFHWKDSLGRPYSSLGNLKKSLNHQNKKVIFAMNGGMYQKDQSPQGLYIENGKQLSRMNTTQEAYGNFYMQPNGVFYITNSNTGHVCVRDSFPLNSSQVKYATQSGPMLLIDGQYHPKFIDGSLNLNFRNGVGVLPNGDLIFAISKGRINFYDFATFFKEKGCLNALYLDGFVSKAYYPNQEVNDLGGAFGVMIAEVEN